MDITTIISTLIAVAIVYVVYRDIKTKRQLRIFTTPPGLPILGHFFYFSSDKALLSNILGLMLKYGGLLKLYLLYGLPVNIVTDPTFLKYLLGTNAILNKPEDYDFLKRWLGSGLLISNRKQWEKSRKILNPAFHVQILEKYFGVFNSVGEILVEKLKNEIGNNSFDVYPYITLCTLDVICETAMGTKLNAQDGKHTDYVESVKEMCRIIIHRSKSPLKAFFVLYVFSKDYWKERRALKILHSLTNSVIRSRKAELAAVTSQKKESEDICLKKKLSFLDLLLQAKIDGRPMRDEEIRQEVDTFMFAGHDTTATAITFTLYCLSLNPEVQRRAFDEQMELFGADTSRCVSSKELQDMQYLDMVIKESLRLYPPVPIYGRSSEEETPFEGGVMPKKISTFVFAYGLHRNPLYYKDPEQFEPERFNATSSQQPYTYLPFSAGPRNCIGQKFAQLEMKVILSKILRNFEILPVSDFVPQLVALTVLRSSNGIRIGLKERV